MKKRRIIASLLAFTIGATTLAGCGDSSQPSPSSGSEAGPATSSAASVDTASAEFSYPVNTGETLTYWCELSTNVSPNFTSLGDTPFGKGWIERTGINIEFQHPPTGQQQEQFSLLVADGNLPDLIEYPWLIYPGGPQKAIDDGNIHALNDIMDQYCPNLKAYLEANPEVDKMIKTDSGNYYLFPFIRGDKILQSTIGLFLRKDWLDELDMEVPETIDEWHTVLTAFKEQKGAIAPLSYEYTMGALTEVLPFTLAYNTSKMFYVGSDSKVHFGAIEPGYKEFLQTFNQWYKEGLIDQDLGTLALDQVSAKMTNGSAGASVGWAGSRMGVWTAAAKESDPGYELVPTKIPVINKGDIPEMGTLQNPYPNQGGVAISTSCKNVELAARLMDYAYSPEGHMYFNFGIEGESYNMVEGYPTYTDVILNNPNGWPIAQSMSAYIRGNYNGPFVQDVRYLEQYYTLDGQKISGELWAYGNGAKHILPTITPTTEESKEFAVIMNEINTYRDEMTLKFILGTESIDNFDAYVKTIENMNIARAIEIQNGALERFYNR